MTYLWTQLGINEITNLYLYGTRTKPTVMVDESLIRSKDYKLEIVMDAVSFMGTGPGRFANGAMSPLADDFMSGRVFQSAGVRQEFSLSDVAKIVTPDVDPTKYGFFSLQQYNFPTVWMIMRGPFSLES